MPLNLLLHLQPRCSYGHCLFIESTAGRNKLLSGQGKKVKPSAVVHFSTRAAVYCESKNCNFIIGNRFTFYFPCELKKRPKTGHQKRFYFLSARCYIYLYFLPRVTSATHSLTPHFCVSTCNRLYIRRLSPNKYLKYNYINSPSNFTP